MGDWSFQGRFPNYGSKKELGIVGTLAVTLTTLAGAPKEDFSLHRTFADGRGVVTASFKDGWFRSDELQSLEITLPASNELLSLSLRAGEDIIWYESYSAPSATNITVPQEVLTRPITRREQLTVELIQTDENVKPYREIVSI